jgi:hypothetical protein
LRFIFRWHLTSIHGVEDVLPKLGGFVIRDIIVEEIKSSVCVLFLFAVAAKAVCLHVSERSGFWFVCVQDRGSHKRREGHYEHEVYEPRAIAQMGQDVH